MIDTLCRLAEEPVKNNQVRLQSRVGCGYFENLVEISQTVLIG